MSEHSRSRQTTAQPQHVWEIWSDTSTWASWNPDVASMEPGLKLALGAETTMNTKAGRHHLMKVAALEPGRSFSLETSPVPLTRFIFTCRVDPADDGSRIQQSVRMAGPLGWLVSATGGSQVAAGFTPILDGLAAEAEKQ